VVVAAVETPAASRLEMLNVLGLDLPSEGKIERLDLILEEVKEIPAKT
jgi:hypothetical protein